MLSFRRPPPAVYQLVTRTGCHLCDEMAALLDAALPELACAYTALNIDDDPALVARFSDIVPVLLRDGQAVAKVRLDRRTLERIVRRRI